MYDRHYFKHWGFDNQHKKTVIMDLILYGQRNKNAVVNSNAEHEAQKPIKRK